MMILFDFSLLRHNVAKSGTFNFEDVLKKNKKEQKKTKTILVFFVVGPPHP